MKPDWDRLKGQVRFSEKVTFKLNCGGRVRDKPYQTVMVQYEKPKKPDDMFIQEIVVSNRIFRVGELLNVMYAY